MPQGQRSVGVQLIALTSAHGELAPPPLSVQDLKMREEASSLASAVHARAYVSAQPRAFRGLGYETSLRLGASPFTRYLIVYLHIGEAVILVV